MKHFCPYLDCQASFPRPFKLKIHVKKVHLKKALFMCSYPDCNKDYTQAAHLKRHIQTSHQVRVSVDSPPVFKKCSFPGCEKTFETKDLLHHKKSHELKKEFKCSFCAESFITKNLLEKHVVIHTGKPRFLCPQCPLTFNDNHVFLKHKSQAHVIHHCKHAGCEDLQFDNFSLLRKHESSVHPVKFSCVDCDKQFLRKLHLLEHISSEHEGMSFKCTHENCGKNFAYKRNLDCHVRLHHQNKRFVCTECERELSTKQKLQEHITKIHQGTAKPKINFKNRSKSAVGEILGVYHDLDKLLQEEAENMIQQTCKEDSA